MLARDLLVHVLCTALVILPTLQAAAQQPLAATAAQAGKGGAAELMRQAERAVAFTVKEARSSKDPKLAPANAEAKPFWKALQKLNVAVDKAERGLFLKDETFFKSLGEATSATQEAKATLEMTGARAPGVSKGLDKVDRAINTARENYTHEGRRAKAGGKLTAKEATQLATLKKKQKELDAKLEELEARSKKSSAATKKQIERVRKEARRVRNARNDTGGLFAALMAFTVINGLIWGWSWWWGPWWGGWWGGFGFVDIYYESIDIIDIDYDWDWADEDLDLDDLDLDVDLDDSEIDTMDEYIDAGDYDLSDAEAGELAAEGGFEMDDVGGLEAEGLEAAGLEDAGVLEEMELPEAGLDDAGLDGGGLDAGGFDDGGFDGGGFDDGGFDDFGY